MNDTRGNRIVLIVLIMFVCANIALATTWYVDASAAPDGDGTTPATAFVTIQAGIDAALDGDVVQLADGTYTGEGNRDLSLAGKAITITSLNGPDSCILDGEDILDPGYSGFTINTGENRDTVLEGLTLSRFLRAIIVQDASPTIRNCRFKNNDRNFNHGEPFYGASLQANNSSLSVEDSVFYQDYFAVSVSNFNCTASYRRCEFTRNELSVLNVNSTVEVLNSVFHDNQRSGTSGFDPDCGGGLSNIDSDVTTINCLFHDNTAAGGAAGGAVGNLGGTFTSINCTYARNKALIQEELFEYEGYGGAIFSANNAAVHLYNCIFWGNVAEYYGNDYCGGQVTAQSTSFPLNPLLRSPFIDMDNDDYRLKLDSGCINTGDNSLVPVGITQDLGGDPRFNGIVDRGVYEYSHFCGNGNCELDESICTCPGDCGIPSETEEDCFDAIDNDCDGLTDSEDVDDCGPCGNDTCEYYEDQCNCPADCGTPPAIETTCSDAIDNDCDGYTDLADSDCRFCGNDTCDPDETICSCPEDCGTPQTAETLCTDGIDNDCDGVTDLTDTDCHICGDGVCSPGERDDKCFRDCEPSTIIFVDSSATGHPDGTSWETAYRHPANALQFAEAGQSIWVAAGQYAIENATLDLIDGVSLYGGFEGYEVPGEFHLDNRDFETNGRSVLSGSGGITAVNISNPIVFDGFRGSKITITSSSITIRNGSMNVVIEESSDVTIENTTIYYGYSTMWALKCNDSSVNLKDCEFANGGRAVYLDQSEALFVNTNIQGFGHDILYENGGAMDVFDSNVTMINCMINDNWVAGHRIKGGRGGGIYIERGTLTLINCLMTGNNAFAWSEWDDGHGGAIAADSTVIKIFNSIFWNNYAAVAGDNIYGGSVTWSCSGGSSDPMFADEEAGNFYLLPSSPYINMGCDSLVPSGIDFDLNNNPRFVGSVDVGPFECSGQEYCGNGVCDVNESSCNCPRDCGQPEAVETDCTDGIDNDCNHLIDMYDPYCPHCGNGVCQDTEDVCTCPDDCGLPSPTETECDDGIDNDCNGLTDWNDPNCTYCRDGTCDEDENQCTCPQDCGTPPATETTCDDDFDNDCDGLTDLDDTDCWICGNGTCDPDETFCSCPADCGTPQSVETLCNDGLDNDCDGLNDLDDTDCHICGDGVCSSTESAATCPMDCDASTIIYVDSRAPLNGDGASWATAYQHPKNALKNAAAGQTIWVAAGQYETIGTEALPMVDGVSFIGGFNGTEAPGSFNLADRDLVSHETVLTGGSLAVLAANIVNQIDFDGFTITDTVQGIDVTASKMTIRNCLFDDNGCDFGPVAIGVRDASNTTIENCRFIRNQCGYTLDCLNSTLHVSNCDIRPGTLGVHLENSTATFVNTKIHGFDMQYENGAGMQTNDSNITMINCAMYDNTVGGHKGMGGYGGAIYASGTGSLTLINSLFVNNEAYEWGKKTWAAYGGAIAASSLVNIYVRNSIFWDNHADIDGDNIWGGNVSSSSSFMGSTNPMFVDQDNDNFYLLPASPCINAGSDSFVPAGIDLDLRNSLRFVGRVDIGPYEYYGAAFCGNGVCDEGEDQCSCPEDCGPPPADETNCTDGIDNDCDGLIDDDDPYCPHCGNGECQDIEDSCTCPEDCGAPIPNEVNCEDGKDDDCDGLADYDDPDCTFCGDDNCDYGENQCNCPQDCGLPPHEDCYDGIDNDCDLLADDMDPDCNCGDGTCTEGEDACHCPQDCGTPPTIETECHDQQDNDCDGLTDYQDPDCIRPGDIDRDGDVDLSDFHSFQMCWNLANPYCIAELDFNDNGELDLDDFATFEANMTGPQ